MLAIELKSVTKKYPGVVALEHIDLSVKEKSIHGFLGPNGAGKSTTMNIITGLIPATSGNIKVFGDESKNHLIGHLPENSPLYHNMRVIDYLRFCQDIHDVKNRALLNDVIDKVGLAHVQNKMIAHLSKGYKQRVGLAQTLVFGARIIILDEPMAGLDPHAVRQMRELVLELKKDHTILLCTHQLDEAAKVCDEVTIIENGLVKKTGTISDLRSELSGAKKFIAELKDFSDEDEKRLLSLGVNVKSKTLLESGEVKVILEVNSVKEMRSAIIKTLSQYNDLYSFAPEQRSLEDIFKEVIKK